MQVAAKAASESKDGEKLAKFSSKKSQNANFKNFKFFQCV